MNWWDRSITFFKEAYAELQKVTWLSRKEVVGSTAVILVLIVILSLFISLIDFILLNTVGLFI